MLRFLLRLLLRKRVSLLSVTVFSLIILFAFLNLQEQEQERHYVTKRVFVEDQPYKLNIPSKECAIPSNWRYPFCEGKVQWMQGHWQTQRDCYIKKHNINASDNCSILRFLSETEAWCPLLPGREKPNPLLSRPKTHLHANKSGLMELLKPEYFAWMKGRINHFWPHWIEGLQLLKKRKTNFDNRRSQNILIFLGAFEFQPFLFHNAFSGGPLGELVQWSDVIASLYILGHNITISANRKDLYRLINIPKDKGCANRARDDEFDIIYTDYVGTVIISDIVQPNHSQYRCKFRVLDSFGTEAEFNLQDYPHPIEGGKSIWALGNFNLQQLMTMFPHSPDNTFLGFVVDAPPKSVPIVENTHIGKPVGLVYGKNVEYFEGKIREFLDVLEEYFEIHATIADLEQHKKDVNDIIPQYVVIHGLLQQAELWKLLDKAKVFIGLGFPYEGPAPLEAIAHGCIFLNAKLNPPQNRLNNAFFKDKPTFRTLTSQHPYTEDFIGEPYVFTVDISNKTAVRIAAEKILKTQVQPYLPLEWTPEGMLERLNSFTENMDFCTKDSKIWPPESQNQLIKGKIGVSCKDVCVKKGLICESIYFHIINKQDSFKKLEIDCQTYKKEIILYAPSYEPKNMSCTLQNHPLVFSCVAKNPSQVRLCPCRDFQSQQVALCKKCL